MSRPPDPMPAARAAPSHASRRSARPAVACLGTLAVLALGCLPAGAALADYCLDCLAIDTDKRVYRPSDEVVLNLGVEPGRIAGETVDAYVAAVQPDNRVRMLHSIPGWELRGVEDQRMRVKPSADGAVGEYRLWFVLAEPGADPLDSRRWLSASFADIAVLPQDWTPPDQPLVLRNGSGLPRVVTHGGGEIHGQLVSNSLQALDAAYAAGQRFFELDFSWTSDRHLVLVHDWEQNFRRLFPRGEGVPSKREFDALDMAFGLDQLNVDELVAWLEAHPQARIITDIKRDNLSGLYYIAARVGDTLTRFIPQIHAPDEYERARALGFENLILTLYSGDMDDNAVLNFLRGRELLAVTLPLQRALEGETAALLREQGVFVYTHSVNAPALLGLLHERGVSGIYSDRLLPAP